jgi:hypothetical protein
MVMDMSFDTCQTSYAGLSINIGVLTHFCNFSQEALTTSKGTNQHTAASISKRVISLKEGNGNLKKSGDNLPWLHI